MNFDEFVEKIKLVDESANVRAIQRIASSAVLSSQAVRSLSRPECTQIYQTLYHLLNESTLQNPRRILARLLDQAASAHYEARETPAIMMANTCPETNV